VKRVQAAAAVGAQEGLAALAEALRQPITRIAIRVCPVLPPTIEERIADTRAAAVADSILYRQALAAAGQARGWSVSWYDRDQVVGAAAATLDGRDLAAHLSAMGRALGPPWQAQHRLAATAALAALGAGSDG
jgi:hypothetical protein